MPASLAASIVASIGAAETHVESEGEVVRQFQDAESEYLQWLGDHPHGYVINSARRPAPNYLVLHRARCKSISTTWSNYTTRDYIKTCSDSRDELAQWASDAVGGQARECALCKP